MNKRISVGIFFLIFVFLVCTINFSLQAQNEKKSTTTSYDNTPIKIGILRNHDLLTARMQAVAGNWKAKLFLKKNITATESSKLDEVVIELPEGEEITLQSIAKGIIVRSSIQGEIKGYFGKVEFSDGWLLNIDFPNLPDFLCGSFLEVDFYQGNILFSTVQKLSEFLVSVVSIMSSTSEPEAIKAQIIAARTFCLFSKSPQRHASDSYDVCDQFHCLPYLGKGFDRELVELLVENQKNRVMLHQGKFFLPYYTDTCSGRLSSAKEIFGKEDLIHVAQDDRFDQKSAENCFHSAFFNWIREMPEKMMSDFLTIAFSTNPNCTFNEWAPSSFDSSGRVTNVKLKGQIAREMDEPLKVEKMVTGQDFCDNSRRYFGPNAFPSMRFTIEPLSKSTVVNGRGKGLGVGMCLLGADGMAKKGAKYSEILNFYYKNITISPPPENQPASNSRNISYQLNATTSDVTKPGKNSQSAAKGAKPAGKSSQTTVKTAQTSGKDTQSGTKTSNQQPLAKGTAINNTNSIK
ncbi:MAG: SpoIID/LytB domain-containing protein [Candidatus Riflebacteria bacterium]|nr:SpoIID/LytB domain-containing protein [Candidatus Riflebacteria bacterium]